MLNRNKKNYKPKKEKKKEKFPEPDKFNFVSFKIFLIYI